MTGTTTHLALSLEAVPSSARDARSAVADAISSAGWPGRAVDDVRLCVSEAVANVVRHAYATSGALRVVVESRDDELVVTVQDWGRGLGRRAARETTGGGFGLRIIERLTEHVDVTSEPGAGTSIIMAFAFPREDVQESRR